MDCSMPGFPVPYYLPEFAQNHAPWVSDAIQPLLPQSPPSPPDFNISKHLIFSSELVLCIRWPKYWSFSFSISTSKEYSGLLSFRIASFYLLAVQVTLKNLLQHHKSINSLVLSLLYGPTLISIHDYWKNHGFDYMDLCRQSGIS